MRGSGARARGGHPRPLLTLSPSLTPWEGTTPCAPHTARAPAHTRAEEEDKPEPFWEGGGRGERREENEMKNKQNGTHPLRRGRTVRPQNGQHGRAHQGGRRGQAGACLTREKGGERERESSEEKRPSFFFLSSLPHPIPPSLFLSLPIFSTHTHHHNTHRAAPCRGP